MNPKDAAKFLTDDNKALLEEMKESLKNPLSQSEFETFLKTLSEARGVKLGAIAQPLRVALTGKTASPGLCEILEILGPERTLARIEAAQNWKP